MMLTDKEIDALWPDITTPQKVVRREIARAVIEENNKKVLADLKPLQLRLSVAHANGGGVPVTGSSAMNVTEYQKITDVYSADQVAALIQERDALAARVNELGSALDLCYEHCRLYHPPVEKNNVGEAVKKALKATS